MGKGSKYFNLEFPFNFQSGASSQQWKLRECYMFYNAVWGQVLAKIRMTQNLAANSAPVRSTIVAYVNYHLPMPHTKNLYLLNLIFRTTVGQNTNLHLKWLQIFKLFSTVFKRNNLYVLQCARIVVHCSA